MKAPSKPKQKKPTCGALYLESLNQFCTNDEQRKAFAAGHVNGQAEKVYLGACIAAMFRPQPENHEWLLAIVEAIAGRYGLRVLCLSYVDRGTLINEIWISRRDSIIVSEWDKYPVNSPTWHSIRGRACGVPADEVDYVFHERRGYAEPCDGLKPSA